jgi:hypothetical protein
MPDTDSTTNAAPSATVRAEITLSPFYHSAVNAVTQPNKATWTSDYFIDRWMPLLGGNGTLIVLALRRLGFLNRKTGECRDEILVSRAELAARAGISEDTLTRELGISKKTGLQQNPWLQQFVQKRTRNRRDAQGRLWREESAYWVAMDDPIHPDDWPLVEEAIRAEEKRLEQAASPKTQIAFSAGPPKTQSAFSAPQNAAPKTQSAASKTQFASALKTLDSLLLEKTLKTPAAPGIVASLPPEGVSGGWSDLPPAEQAAWEEEARAWFAVQGLAHPSARTIRHTAQARWKAQARCEKQARPPSG